MTAQHSGEGASPPLLRGVELPSPKYVDDGKWRDKALCREHGNNVFFFEMRRGQSPKAIREHIDHAINICISCEVRLQCLNFAIQSEERYGVWGGVDFKKVRGAVRKELLSAVSNL